MSLFWRICILAAGVTGFVVWEVTRLKSIPKTPPPTEQKSPGLVDCTRVIEGTQTPSQDSSLIEVTDSFGLDFQHVVGPLGTYFMPESIGAGGALADFDGDGRLDLYLVNCGQSPHTSGDLAASTRVENRLFLQQKPGQFTDATADSGLGDRGYGAGCAVGDLDNDGDLDVYITNYGADQLYLNRGDVTFENATRAAGIDQTGWGTCVVMLDFDRDGWLDLFVINYTEDPEYDHSIACGFYEGLVSYCGPHKFLPTVDRLLKNEGLQTSETGEVQLRFTDVTETAGLSDVKTYGFGVVSIDPNRDGWPDLFVANDGEPNRLWINQQDGTFREEAVVRGVALNGNGAAEAGMGVAVGDVNRDGLFELALSHLSQESSTLYRAEPSGSFVDETEAAGMSESTWTHTGWGTALVDLDHDGNLDLPTVNGLVVPCHSGFPFHGEDKFQTRTDEIEDAAAFWRDYADANQLLMGTDDGKFVDAAERGGAFCSSVESSRALIHGDVDNDGDLDLVVTNCGSRARLYQNDLEKQGNWLAVRVVDPALNRDAYGAEVTLVSGEKKWHRLASPATSYLASHDPRVHFGLGDATQYDSIVVRWPSGPVEDSLEIFPGGTTDRQIEIRRGAGQPLKEQP